ncbi:MAG: CHASE3 domain-containing protein [Chloroflexota bacterium]|nr:CHASE3 domain-containing protein [Chloroflexota bacterium]
MIARIGKNIVHSALRGWRRVPLRVQGKVQIALPLLAVVCSAIMAIYGNYQRAHIEAAIQRHFETVSGLDTMLTLMVNAETGMRGYLLTKHEEFLQPYATASQNLPVTIAQLHVLAESEPGFDVRTDKLGQLSQLNVLIDQQMTDLAWQRQYIATSSTSSDEIYSHLIFGKQLMDHIRANVLATHTQEAQLLNERVQEINAIRQRDYLAVFLTLIVALGTRFVAWYLFNTGVLRRIDQLVENTRSLRHGAPLPFLPSGKQDVLGSLEQEILLVDKQLNKHHGTSDDVPNVIS